MMILAIIIITVTVMMNKMVYGMALSIVKIFFIA